MTSLFDAAEGLARNDHPDTSKAAAKAIAVKSGTLRWRVLFALSYIGAGTAEQLERNLDLSGNTVRPRLVELRKAGMVIQTEHTATTRSGRAACLWQITEAGCDALSEARSEA